MLYKQTRIYTPRLKERAELAGRVPRIRDAYQWEAAAAPRARAAGITQVCPRARAAGADAAVRVSAKRRPVREGPPSDTTRFKRGLRRAGSRGVSVGPVREKSPSGRLARGGRGTRVSVGEA